jgi:hypothetical protein
MFSVSISNAHGNLMHILNLDFFISHPITARLFSFQHSHTSCAPDMLLGMRGRVEKKKDKLLLDER